MLVDLVVVQVVVIVYEVGIVHVTLHVAVDFLVIVIIRFPRDAVLLIGHGAPETDCVALDLDLQLGQG